MAALIHINGEERKLAASADILCMYMFSMCHHIENIPILLLLLNYMSGETLQDCAHVKYLPNAVILGIKHKNILPFY